MLEKIFVFYFVCLMMIIMKKKKRKKLNLLNKNILICSCMFKNVVKN